MYINFNETSKQNMKVAKTLYISNGQVHLGDRGKKERRNESERSGEFLWETLNL